MPGRLEPEPIERRDFLGIAGVVAAGVAIVGSVLGMARLPKPRVLPEASNRFRAGNPAEYPSGTKQVLPEKKVQMIATEEGIGAVSLVCTHLGCIVQESDAGFSCPCHGSRFGPNGELRQGPAPRPLPWFAVSQAPDGALVVDRGSEVDPGTFYQPIA